MKKKIISTVLTACMMAGMLTGTGAYSVAADSSVINMDEDPYQVAIQMVVLPGTEVADEAAMEVNQCDHTSGNQLHRRSSVCMDQ